MDGFEVVVDMLMVDEETDCSNIDELVLVVVVIVVVVVDDVFEVFVVVGATLGNNTQPSGVVIGTQSVKNYSTQCKLISRFDKLRKHY